MTHDPRAACEFAVRFQPVGGGKFVPRIVEPNQHNSRTVKTMPGQVVGESADGLADLGWRVASETLLALDPVGFEVSRQGGEFLIGQAKLVHGRLTVLC